MNKPPERKAPAAVCFSIPRSGYEYELPAAVENIVDLHEFFAIIFDEPNVLVETAAIHLNRHFGVHVIHEMMIVKNDLAVHVHDITLFRAIFSTLGTFNL